MLRTRVVSKLVERIMKADGIWGRRGDGPGRAAEETQGAKWQGQGEFGIVIGLHDPCCTKITG